MLNKLILHTNFGEIDNISKFLRVKKKKEARENLSLTLKSLLY